ncbi:hypothetical protein ABTX71_07990 [Streptomyces parvulus]
MGALLIDCIVKPGSAGPNTGAVVNADTTVRFGRMPLLKVTAS